MDENDIKFESTTNTNVKSYSDMELLYTCTLNS